MSEERESIAIHRDKLLFLMFAGAISIILLVIGGYKLVEFTDSTAFCGQLCHNVMEPEYTAYKASPHSRVLCASCHVGSGADYLVRSKISGIPLVITTIRGDYHRPIPTPVENLRPARETCEQCHRPERFAGDLVRIHTTYQPDENNTVKTDTRVMRVGGGESGAARDIHWHIAAEVYYLSLDSQRQTIAWVSVQEADGERVFIDPKQADQVTPERLQKEKRLMDCVDCHNRATHVFSSPNELLDMAFMQGRLDSSLPYLKREALKALDPPAPSEAEAAARVEKVKDFYRTTYPNVWEEKGLSIDSAVDTIKGIAHLTNFPNMNVTWKTYVDNAGHQNSLGCLRCHGKLVAQSGPDQGKAIDASCDSCHYFALPK